MPKEPSRGADQVTHAAFGPAREDSISRRAALVQRFPLFANVSEADCREILSRARQCEYSRHQTIFVEGDPVGNLVLLTSGSARLVKVGQNGAEVILRLVGPGGIVGVTGFCGERRHRSMAQALSASTSLVWEMSVFEALTERFPVLLRNILRIVSECLEELEERYRDASTEKVAIRLSRELVRLFTQMGHPVNDTLEIHLSREQLAQLTGTTLSTVSRLLSEWDQRGLVSARRESVSVHDIQALRALAETE